MKTLSLSVTKSFFKNNSADSAKFTVYVNGDGIKIEGTAVMFYNSMTFNLCEELENDLEESGIDYADIVDALESSTVHIEVEIDDKNPYTEIIEEAVTYAYQNSINANTSAVRSAVEKAIKRALELNKQEA